MEAIRSLIDAVVLVPEADGLAIELRGQLAGILGLCGGHKTKPGFAGRAVLWEQMKLVAGARNHRQPYNWSVAI